MTWCEDNHPVALEQLVAGKLHGQVAGEPRGVLDQHDADAVPFHALQ